jgi:phosphate-selective porin OprO/OprP
VQHSAWQVAASYFLTGEQNSFSPVTPAHPFSLSGSGLGAWELAARIAQLEVDENAFPLYANPDTSAHGATSWAVGLNWYLNKNVKLSLDYEQSDFKGGISPLLAKGEKVIFTRAQISF